MPADEDAVPSGGAQVTVVTPVHNGERFLRECIESVLAQTFDNWEYLIVENQSSDRTRAIAEEYAAGDPRIRVLQTEHLLPRIENFNFSLQHLSPASDYCKVLHADDLLYPECLERMVELGEQEPTVGVIGAYRRIGERIDPVGLPESRHVLSGREVARSVFLGGPHPYLFGSPSSLLIRTPLLRENLPVYDEDCELQADQSACFRLLRSVDFGFVHEILTFTRRHEDSGMAFFRPLGAQPAESLLLLARFGPDYLTPDEYRRRAAAGVAKYAVALARRLARFRDRTFRTYHARILAGLRDSLRPVDVGRGIVAQLERLATSRLGHRAGGRSGPS